MLYEPFGPPASWSWGNGSLKTYKDHDLDGRQQIGEVRNGITLHKQSLTWDKAGRLTALADGVASNNSKTFGYNPLDRLFTAYFTSCWAPFHGKPGR